MREKETVKKDWVAKLSKHVAGYRKRVQDDPRNDGQIAETFMHQYIGGGVILDRPTCYIIEGHGFNKQKLLNELKGE